MPIAAPLVSAMKNKTRNVIFNEGPESYYPSKAAAKVWLVSKQITAVLCQEGKHFLICF